MSGYLAEIEEAVASGGGGATLIDWESGFGLFPMDNDSAASIEAAKAQLSTAGWKWNESWRRMEREGFQVWFRSQGTLSPPIAQWSRINA